MINYIKKFGILAFLKLLKVSLGLGLSTAVRSIYANHRPLAPTNDAFFIYESAVLALFGKPVDIKVGRINKNLLLALKKESQTSLKDNIFGSASINDERDYLIVDDFSTPVKEKLDENLIVHPIHEKDPKTSIINELHKELRRIFAKDINSPFVFVNTRMWTSKPASGRFGPNSMHKDGFKAGHMKIMIYLSEMNKEEGYFITKQKNFCDLPSGTAILFRNSDIEHSGVPGRSANRICIEVTLMRALVNGSQDRKGHFFGRHLISPLLAHKENS